MKPGKSNRKKTVIVFGMFLMVLLGVTNAHAEVRYRLNTEAAVATDSDVETQYLFGIGTEIMDAKKKEDMRASATVGVHTFTGNGDTESLGFLRLRGYDKINDYFAVAAKAALYQGSGWTQFAPGATLSIRPVPKAYIELFYDRDLVDTIRAVEARDYVDTAGISADYEVVKQLTVVGAYFHQFFRDENDRDGYVGKLVYSFGESGFSTAASYKYVSNEFKSPFYFSPKNVTDLLVTGQYRRPVWGEKYVFRARGGLGYQWVDNFGSRSGKFLTLAEAGLKGWFSDDYGVDALIGFSNNAGYGNYSRFYSQLVLTYAF